MYILRISIIGKPSSYVHSDNSQILRDFVYNNLYLTIPNEGWIQNLDGSYYARWIDGLGHVRIEYEIKKSMEIGDYVPDIN